MKYVIYIEDINSFFGYDFSIVDNISLAKKFSRYNPTRFYYKSMLEKEYKKVFFRKIVLLDANISLSDILRRL